MVRGVVSRWRAVACSVQPSAAWSRPPVSNGIERGALEEPTQARPATRPLKPNPGLNGPPPIRQGKREEKSCTARVLIWAYLVHLGAAGFPCSGSERALSIHAVYQRFSSICDPAASRCSVKVRASGEPFSLKPPA